MEFLTKEEFSKIIEERDYFIFSEVLTRVFNKGIEQAMCHIPMMVQRLSTKIDNVNRVMKKYFEDNPDFLKYTDIFFKTIQRIEIEFTGMSFEEVIEKARPEIQRKIDNVKGGMPNES